MMIQNKLQRSITKSEGIASFLNDITMYPSLKGMRTNLYKNFIERSWSLLGHDGIAGLLHPEGVFDDPKGRKIQGRILPSINSTLSI